MNGTSVIHNFTVDADSPCRIDPVRPDSRAGRMRACLAQNGPGKQGGGIHRPGKKSSLSPLPNISRNVCTRSSTSSCARITAPATTAKWLSTFLCFVAKNDPSLAAAMRASSLSNGVMVWRVRNSYSMTFADSAYEEGNGLTQSTPHFIACVAMDLRRRKSPSTWPTPLCPEGGPAKNFNTAFC